MSGILTLPAIVQSVVLIIYTLIAAAEIYCLIVCIIYKTGKNDILLSVLLFLFSCLNLFFLADCFWCRETDIYTSPIIIRICSQPWAVTLVLIVMQIAAVCFGIGRVNYKRKTNITPMSIKQGADSLPTGLCCYDEDGRPTLINHCMQRLCRSLTGEPLLNGSDFWQRLTDGNVEPSNTVIKTGLMPMILLEGGEVRSFSRVKIVTGRKIAYELSAADITEQYELSRRLMAYNRELEQVKKRLELYNENVADITREKEILAAKVSIHDRLGNALLAARRYIETGEEAVSRQALLDIWQSNISLLRREAEQPDENSTLDGLYEAAEIMGIAVYVTGTLPPQDNRTMRFLMSGARECLTNAVHHAKATKLNICISAENDYNIIEYTNDGIPPEDEIIEGGGLSSLRKSVEAEGGVMQTACVPQFCLTIKIPKSGVLM